MGWTDHRGDPVDVPEPPPAGSHYAAIGELQGSTYHRNAFAKGTAQEVAVLAEVLDLSPGGSAVGSSVGSRVVLDVGCGDGRHVRALRATGVAAVGLDLSLPVLRGRGPGERPPLVAGLAQQLPFATGSIDAIISVCQGGFGLTPSHDDLVVGEWCRVLRTGGRVAMTAFSLVYAIRYLGEGEAIDVDRGLHHHTAEVRGPDGARRPFDLWTAAYSAPHLREMLSRHGLDVLGTAGVEAGAYQTARPPTLEDPEILIWATRRRAGEPHQGGS